jgi:hypothetical protein
MGIDQRLVKRWHSLLLAIIAVGIGMGLAVGTAAWNLALTREQAKTFQKFLPTFLEPVQLLEIRTANKTFTLPDQLAELTALTVRRGEVFAKTEEWLKDTPVEAQLKNTPFRVKGIPERPYIEIELDQGGDWLKGVAFKLKNVSDKEIIYIDLSLDFPETKSSGHEMSFPITLGRRPGSRFMTNEPFSAKPGEEFTMTLDESQYQRLSGFIEESHPVSGINTVTVRIGFVIFSDGIAWGAGDYYRQDPNVPDRYINVGSKPPAD